MKKRRWPILIIYVIALVVCAVLIYVVPSVLGLLDSTYIAQFGNIEVSDNVEAYIFRDDIVYTADVAGDVNRLVDEGALVKGKSRIVELKGTGKTEISSKYQEILEALGKDARVAEGGVTGTSGYVSYQLDGYETVFSTANMENMNKASLDSISGYGTTECPDRSCAKGEPVFRITMNGNWYLLFWMDNETASKYYEGDELTLVIDGGTIDGKIEHIKTGNDITRLEMHVNESLPVLLSSRKAEVRIILYEASGIILQSESIIEKDGVKGVLVRDKVGDNQFKPVRIKADNGKEAAVYSDFFMDDNMEFVETVKMYDEIVIAPTDEDIAAAPDVNDKYK